MNSKKIFKITGIVLASIVLFIVLLLVAISLVLTPKRLTPLVNKYSTQYLDATVKFKSVELSLFEDLPCVSVKLIGGEIVSHAFQNEADSLKRIMPIGADSLLQFEELFVSLNVPSLVVGKVDIRGVRVVEPRAYAYVSPSGKASWEIYTSDTTESAPLDINIEKIEILSSGNLVYESAPDSMKISADIKKLLISGCLMTDKEPFSLKEVDISDMSVNAHLPSQKIYSTLIINTMNIAKGLGHNYKVDFLSNATLKMDTTSYCSGLPISAKGKISFKDEEVGFDDFNISISEMNTLLNGEVRMGEDIAFSDFSLKTNTFSLSNLLSLVPQGMVKELDNIETDISIGLDALADGVYNSTNKKFPNLSVDLKVPHGGLHYKTTNLRDVSLDALFRYDPQDQDSTGVLIRNISIEGSAISIKGKAQIWNILRDPNINTTIKGGLDLDKLSVLLKSYRGITVGGRLGLDLKVQAKASDFTAKKIGNARIKGRMTMDRFLLNMAQDSIRVMVDGGALLFGAYANNRDSLINRGVQMLRVGILVDTTNIKYKDELSIIAAGVKMDVGSAAASMSGDKSEVHPFKGSIEAVYLDVSGLDSALLRLRDAKVGFSILPSKMDKKIPMIKMNIGSRTIVFRNDVNRGVLVRGDISLEATKDERAKDLEVRKQRYLDKLQLKYPLIKRDSLFAHARRVWQSAASEDDFQDIYMDMSKDKGISALLQKWKVNCAIKADGGRLVTPYFPLKNKFRKVDMSFNTNEINLNNTKIISGHSQFAITGKISGIRRALFGVGKLGVNVDINSDTLNINELVQAANAGVAYLESSAEYKQSLIDAADDDEFQKLIDENAKSVGANDLIIIPANVDLDVKLRVKQGYYSKLTLDSIAAELISKDRSLQIKELKAITDIGSFALTALYTTKSKKDISTGFDLEMKDIEVDKLISLIPAVDTLLPMLRSFSGVLTCQIAATAAMDTSMNIILPTLNAACRINGNKMVLLDGETFAEIAKMMRFKNRDKNEIDKISVEMVIRNNQIELFPFIMQLDRYKTAISGIHKLNMDFKYHISVLKSPLPFRIGVNISGNVNDMDNMKFRIGKAKYKDTDIPTYTAIVDTTRLNLRSKITDIFKQGIEAANIKDVNLLNNVQQTENVAPEMDDLTAADSLKLQEEGIIDKELDDTIYAELGVRGAPPRAKMELSNKEARQAKREEKRRNRRK
ncbi:MAG: AsmA-like C-terminal region-containing protein [Rikenellaceae bacterium]